MTGGFQFAHPRSAHYPADDSESVSPSITTDCEKSTASLQFMRENDRRGQYLYFEGLKLLQEDKARLARAYLEAACANSPAACEPYLFLAIALQLLGNSGGVTEVAETGRALMGNRVISWDRCLTADARKKLLECVSEPANSLPIKRMIQQLVVPDELRNPILAQTMLLESVLEHPPAPRFNSGQDRFFSYLKMLRDGRVRQSLTLYPGLGRRSWYDPNAFGITKELETQFPLIQAEALALPNSHYFEEGEDIGRSGRWQVCMFYEAGRRVESVCEQCPVTSSILERSVSVRRTGGLIYLSRMAAHTHVHAHSAKNNIRLRLHLPISVPEGDCAIRVDSEIHRWKVGKCIVFDDTYEHEVWNRTDEQRLVLVVDIWHPDLSTIEREALDAIYRFSSSKAAGMLKTWRRNNIQRRKGAKPATTTVRG